MSQFFDRLGVPTIYAYTTPSYRDFVWLGAKSGRGLLKVGYTRKEVEKRIWEQFPTKTPELQPFSVVLTEEAIDKGGRFFTDRAVHNVLKKNGFRQVNGEWYECTKQDVLGAIEELRQGKSFAKGRYQTFQMRPEQRFAVALTKEYFERYEYEKEGRASHFLWNAKMRFGKTFASYQLAKAMGWTRVMVLTYKPAVEDAWREDLDTHTDFESWQFIGRGETLDGQDESKPIVWFASFQDILGRTKDGKIKDRFELAHAIEWDCVILDEYHFGAWRDAARDLYDSDSSERIDKQSEEFNEEIFPLFVKQFLYLSGTPFRALASGEFLEDQIFNWSYSDEQRAKEEWDEANGFNPYAELPQIVLMTYQMPDAIREVALQGENNEFDLNEFFKAKELTHDQFLFEHEKEVQMWLSLMRGQYMPANAQAGSDAVKPPIPFEDVRLQEYLLHTFWFLPSVAACKAMKQLLGKPQNNFFSEYKIIVAAGAEAGMGLDALIPVREAIGDPLKTKSITLSCGKLTTGVSVPAWAGIFMLRNTTSAESYFQAAFRVQTPFYVTNKDGTDPYAKEIIKPKCYVFDFAPNRALRLISEYSSRLDLNDNSTVERKVEEFIRFLPVLCYDGFTMSQLDAGDLLDIVAAGTASSMLAKRWQSAQLVNVDNYTLEKLLNRPDLLEVLEGIEAFRNLGKDLSKVISSEKALNNTKKEGKEPTKQQKSDDKENKGFKKMLREKLLKFVTRVPVFMYLTDYREETLKQVITNIEPELFTKVTGLKVRDFEKLCEIGVFNSQVMNSAIFAFKRFEESSLTYAGGRYLPEYVGGFDTTVRREEIHAIEGL